ncbi:hypothetical protein QJS10_CPA10g00811 [Acorus calamus]|uniref:DNA repair protein RAD51 homolog 3 n=1 Tax=Acorus calamus TaxID=4465 RepID=A0AAV9E0A4_ACOCL|nr:hypothetical protein QJS10_CPA10g00811 [Acorus calamus]
MFRILGTDLNVAVHEAADIFKMASENRLVERTLGGGQAVVPGYTSKEIRPIDEDRLGAQTAWDIFREEQTLKHITTFCDDLDTILREVEFQALAKHSWGMDSFIEATKFIFYNSYNKQIKKWLKCLIAPDISRIQLAVNVQIPADYGGIGGKAVYIDTEGSFMVERASQIAEACIRETLDNFVFQHKDYQMCPEGMQTNIFLSNIFYFRICSYTEQIAVINYLDEFISEHKDVKIVIIDSITFHFRQDFDDMALRTRVLSGLALQLMKLAKNVFSNLYESSFRITMDLLEVDIKLLLFA